MTIVPEYKCSEALGYFDLTGRYLGDSLERLKPGYYVTQGKVVKK